jgi:anti-sigma factor RsiW
MTDWTPLARGSGEEAAERETREARHQVLIELLGAYADRELPPETASQIEAHLVGCARCRNELAVHQAVRMRLGVAPPVAAPPALRERIVAAIAAAPVPLTETTAVPATHAKFWRRHSVLVAVVMAVLTIAAAVGINVARSKVDVAPPPNVARLGVSPASVPLLNDALVDYRRVTAGDLPGRSRDLDLVRGAVAFPIDPLRVNGVRLLAAWTTDLGGEAAAVLAYRWNDRILLQYLVPENRFFRHPAIRAAVTGNRLLVASANAQGLVAWPTQEAGSVLIGDVAPEQLAQLTTADLLAKTARRGAE